MNSVRIYCLCDGIKIQDLGLSLAKGEAVVVDEVSALGSSDLRLAISAGGVATRKLKGPQHLRPRVTRKPRMTRETPKPNPRKQAPTVEEPSDVEQLKELLKDTFASHRKYVEAMANNITESLKDLKISPDPVTANIDISAIESVVKSALQGISIPAATTVVSEGNLGTVGDSGPMFIPEGIVVDTNTDIGASEESSGFSVDEATEALRAMKKTKKSKSSKKGG